MNSSGIRRGLAAIAVSAVAVTGIPALAGSAFADSVNVQVGAGNVELYNNDSGAVTPTIVISTKPDGTDSTVRLEAGAGANIQTVRFEYRIGGGAYQLIADVTRNDDGAFSFEWSPTEAPFNIAVGTPNIDLRATGLTGATTFGSDTAGGLTLVGNSPNAATINLTADSDQGYYDATNGACANGPANVIVSGTTSLASTNPADAPFLSREDGTGASRDTVTPDIRGNSFSGILSLSLGGATGYNFAGPPTFPNAQDPDQLVVTALTDSAAITEESEDFESYTLYEQTITTVTAVDNGTNTSPDPASITVTVTDQNGQPVGKAQVRSTVTGAVALTNSRGQATFSQPRNVTQYYFADQNCDGTFSPAAGDKRSDNVNANEPSTITISSNPEGDVQVGSTVTETVTVRNGAGNPLPNETVRITRNGPDSSSDVAFRTTNADGQVFYDLTCTTAGTATVNAAVTTTPGGTPFDRSVTDTVNCVNSSPSPVAINAKLIGHGHMELPDRMHVQAPAIAMGARVNLFVVMHGHARKIRSGLLSDDGKINFTVGDANGTQTKHYYAVVKATSATLRDRTNDLFLR